MFDIARMWERLNDQPKATLGLTVSDENTSDDYDAFCSVMDRLACRIGLCVDQVDPVLISVGRPKPGT